MSATLCARNANTSFPSRSVGRLALRQPAFGLDAVSLCVASPFLSPPAPPPPAQADFEQFYIIPKPTSCPNPGYPGGAACEGNKFTCLNDPSAPPKVVHLGPWSRQPPPLPPACPQHALCPHTPSALTLMRRAGRCVETFKRSKFRSRSNTWMWAPFRGPSRPCWRCAQGIEKQSASPSALPLPQRSRNRANPARWILLTHARLETTSTLSAWFGDAGAT